MNDPAITPEIEALIGSFIDGRAEPAEATALAALARGNPVLRRALRAHLLISEISSQLLAPERGAEPFFAGLVQRHQSEQDAEAFTRRVLRCVEVQRAGTVRTATRLLLEVASLSAAALLMIGLLSASAHALMRIGTADTAPTGRHVREEVLRPLDLAALLDHNKDMQ